MFPSPKFQVKVYGDAPPEITAVYVAIWPGLGEAGVTVKSAINAGVRSPAETLAILIVAGTVPSLSYRKSTVGSAPILLTLSPRLFDPESIVVRTELQLLVPDG